MDARKDIDTRSVFTENLFAIFDAMLDSLPDVATADDLNRAIAPLAFPIVAHGSDGVLWSASLGLKTLLGFSDEQIRGLRPFGWIVPDSLRGVPNRLESILHEGHINFVSSIVRYDGLRVPTEVHARRVNTFDGPAVVSCIDDLSMRTYAIDRILDLSALDHLTQLPGRAVFLERLDELLQADEGRKDLLLVYIDLDRLAPLNEMGRDVGDAALAKVGARIAAFVGDRDNAARLGSDEFAILIPAVDEDLDVRAVAMNILDALERPMVLGGVEVSIGMTLGFALSGHCPDARSLLRSASTAMYEAQASPGTHWLQS